RPAVALVGPTASGKSALAQQWAEHHPNVELVAADSMQVYRGMDIGTAKPTPREREVVRHHLVDVVDPSEEFTVARYQQMATAAIAGIEGRANQAWLVGG